MSSVVNNSRIGLLTGLLLALAGVVGGFGGFVVALVLGAVGLLVGRYLDGDLDLSDRSGFAGRGRRN